MDRSILEGLMSERGHGQIENWVRERMSLLTRNGLTKPNVREFLLDVIAEARKSTGHNVEDFMWALNDAFLEAQILIRDMPLIWSGGRFSKVKGINAAEVHIVGLGEVVVELT